MQQTHRTLLLGGVVGLVILVIALLLWKGRPSIEEAPKQNLSQIQEQIRIVCDNIEMAAVGMCGHAKPEDNYQCMQEAEMKSEACVQKLLSRLPEIEAQANFTSDPDGFMALSASLLEYLDTEGEPDDSMPH